MNVLSDAFPFTVEGKQYVVYIVHDLSDFEVVCLQGREYISDRVSNEESTRLLATPQGKEAREKASRQRYEYWELVDKRDKCENE